MDNNCKIEYCNPGLENAPSIPDGLELGTRVASGAYAACYFMDHEEKVEDNLLAKVIPLAKYRASEVDALTSCALDRDGHKNIVSYWGRYIEETEVWIITEYLAGEELTGSIQRGSLDEPACRKIFLQLVMAIGHVHAKHFIHGDLKPANVMFESRDSQNVRVIDFGNACYNSEFQSWKDKPRYTLDYAPPELLTNPNLVTYSPAVDIYGLGATLYTMLVGHPPYGHHSAVDKLRQRMEIEEFNQQSKRWLDASQAFRHLVGWCLQRNPLNRPKLEDILHSEWLQYTRNDPDVGQQVEQPMAAINQPMEETVANATAALAPAAAARTVANATAALAPSAAARTVANATAALAPSAAARTVANATAALAPAAAARTVANATAALAPATAARTVANATAALAPAAAAWTVGRRHAVRHVFRGFPEDLPLLRPPQPMAAINQPMEETVATATAALAPAAAARTVANATAALAPAAADRTVGRRPAVRHVLRRFPEVLPLLRHMPLYRVTYRLYI